MPAIPYSSSTCVAGSEVERQPTTRSLGLRLTGLSIGRIPRTGSLQIVRLLPEILRHGFTLCQGILDGLLALPDLPLLSLQRLAIQEIPPLTGLAPQLRERSTPCLSALVFSRLGNAQTLTISGVGGCCGGTWLSSGQICVADLGDLIGARGGPSLRVRSRVYRMRRLACRASLAAALGPAPPPPRPGLLSVESSDHVDGHGIMATRTTLATCSNR